MLTGKRPLPLSLAAVPILLAVPCLVQAREYVDDRAGLFGQGALEHVQTTVEYIVRTYNVDVMIETYPELPPEWDKQLKDHKADAQRLVDRLAEERADAVNAQGVFILICKSPTRLSVLARPTALERGYSRRDAQQLARRLRRTFARGHYDDGMLRGAVSIRDDLETSALGQRWLWLVGIIGIGIAIWIVLMVIRSKVLAGTERNSIVSDHAEPVSAHALGAPGAPKGQRWLFDDQPADRESPTDVTATRLPEPR